MVILMDIVDLNFNKLAFHWYTRVGNPLAIHKFRTCQRGKQAGSKWQSVPVEARIGVAMNQLALPLITA